MCVTPGIRQVTIWGLVCFYYQWQILTLFKFELRLLIRHRGKPQSYNDLSLIRHWYLDQERDALTSPGSECGATCNFHEDFMCSVACYGGLRVLKLSLNATIFDTRVADFVRLIATHRKRRINTKHSSLQNETWIGRRGSHQVGKCAVLFLESVTFLKCSG